jgi:hypothetical protein
MTSVAAQLRYQISTSLDARKKIDASIVQDLARMRLALEPFHSQTKKLYENMCDTQRVNHEWIIQYQALPILSDFDLMSIWNSRPGSDELFRTPTTIYQAQVRELEVFLNDHRELEEKKHTERMYVLIRPMIERVQRQLEDEQAKHAATLKSVGNRVEMLEEKIKGLQDIPMMKRQLSTVESNMRALQTQVKSLVETRNLSEMKRNELEAKIQALEVTWKTFEETQLDQLNTIYHTVTECKDRMEEQQQTVVVQEVPPPRKRYATRLATKQGV